MSAFKTKKLPQKEITPIKKITEEQIASEIDVPRSSFRISRKMAVSLILGIFIVFFTGELFIRAFQGNEKNGSENFNKSTVASIVENFVSKKVAGTTNILIAGIGGKGHDGSDLTDSIMLASLDGEKNTVTLLSIPRDLYVAYPEKKGAGRINSLYDLGKRNNVGITYLADKVTEITGQKIDHYMVIDFAGFTEIIDILGGIEVDVPTTLIDREYPDNNWGYTVFSVKRGPQVFDGATALKYARSRHSTSDFDRSNRQQLIIKAIKDKATDLGIITNPKKIAEIYGSIMSHLDTDLSIADMVDLALGFADIKSDDINIVSLSQSCASLTKCSPGSYLYSPSRDLFGGSAVIIPENAQINKLSYYDDIRKFVDITFHFPLLRSAERNIVFVSDPSMKARTQEIGIGLAKLGFPISSDKSLTVATGAIENSHVNIYWNEEVGVGIDPESITIRALKYFEESLPYNIVTKNEYINTSGPKIEIVIGKDGKDYFKNLKSAYYVPIPPKSTASGSTGDTLSGTISAPSKPTLKPVDISPSTSGEMTIQPGEWENF